MPELSIDLFDVDTKTDAELEILYRVSCAWQTESMPGDPVGPFAETVQWARQKNKFGERRRFLATVEAAVVGYGNVSFSRNTEENRHLCHAWVYVFPEARRRGYGRQLMAKLLDEATEDGRTSIMGGTTWDSDHEGFLTRFGLERKFKERISRCVLADVDRDLMDEWIAKAAERAADYELISWKGRTPTDMREAWAEALDIMNTAPREGLEFEDEKTTVEQVDEWDRMQAETNTGHWVICARHKPSGQIAGITDIYFSPFREWEVSQGNTGVHPDHRNKGLGRWLKAAMMIELLDERPQAQWIDTENAGSNEPMLHINDAMGFKPVYWSGAWQADIKVIKDHLA